MDYILWLYYHFGFFSLVFSQFRLPENQTTYYNGGPEGLNQDGTADDKSDVAAAHSFTNDNNNDELLYERGLAGSRAQIFFVSSRPRYYAPLPERLTYNIIIISVFASFITTPVLNNRITAHTRTFLCTIPTPRRAVKMRPPAQSNRLI